MALSVGYDNKKIVKRNNISYFPTTLHIPHGIHLFYGPGSKNIVHLSMCLCVYVCLNSSLNLHLQLDDFVNKFEIEGPGVEQDMDKGQKLMEVYAVEFEKVETTRLEMGEKFPYRYSNFSPFSPFSKTYYHYYFVSW